MYHTDPSQGPFILLAFFAFAIAEPGRYPYYLLKMLGQDKSSLGTLFGHVRYNLFIVFYPIGAFCDLMTGYHSSGSLMKTGAYSFLLPNTVNFSFNFPWVVTYFLPTMYILSFPMNYGYLLAQRKKFYTVEKVTVKQE